MAAPSIDDRLLSVWEVMKLLGVSRSTVVRMRRAGTLRSIKVGGLVRFPAAEVARVLRPGGIFSVMDVGQAPQWSPLDAYLREFIIRDNAEPYEAGWAHWDFPKALRDTGFTTANGPDSEIEQFPGASSAHHSRWFAYKPS